MTLPYNSSFRVTSPYGERYFNGINEFHRGIDLVGEKSGIICSVCSGVVGNVAHITDKSNATWQWGLYVRIDSYDGYSFYYCHLASVFVSAGDKIREGDHIGLQGSSGYCTGEHLHLEARKCGSDVDISHILGIENKIGVINLDNRKLVAERFSLSEETLCYIDKLKYADDFYAKLLRALPDE